MKRLSSIFILLAVIFSISTIAYSQPKLTINVTGGYGVPLGDFKTAVPDPGTPPVTDLNKADADFFPYYTKQLINFGLDGKLALGKKGNFRVVLGASYNMFSNSVDARFKADSTDVNGV